MKVFEPFLTKLAGTLITILAEELFPLPGQQKSEGAPERLLGQTGRWRTVHKEVWSVEKLQNQVFFLPSQREI